MLSRIVFVPLVLALALLNSGAAATTCSTSNPYTYSTISNGTTADADPVMHNSDYLLYCANANLAPLVSPSFSGSVGINGVTQTSGVIHATDGTATGLTGPGAELQYSVGGDYGSVDAYDRTALTYKPIQVDGSVVRFANSGSEYMRLSGGNLGIGTTSPAYTLTVNGTAYATTFTSPSDRRRKAGIRPLSDSAIALVMHLKPVTFWWKEPRDDGMRGRQMGFVAQDVLPVLPDAVLAMNDSAKTLSLKYDAFIPVLAKAMQEQQAQIASLVAANRAQAAAIHQLQSQISSLSRRVGVRTAQN